MGPRGPAPHAHRSRRQQREEWDGEGNCVRHTDQLGGVTSSTFGPFDLLTTRTTPDGRTHTFVHDTEQRLVQVVDPAG
ncbi:hypothetical protein [Streptomyces sp. NPDC048710]|uniref:hypothetical protein n=1 Tax=Streptomyces sp. NPDC048710 TaxID=3365586 RepID=UPI00371524C9